MVFLLEEVVVVGAAVLATVAAAGLFIAVVIGLLKEHRDRRASVPAMPAGHSPQARSQASDGRRG